MLNTFCSLIMPSLDGLSGGSSVWMDGEPAAVGYMTIGLLTRTVVRGLPNSAVGRPRYPATFQLNDPV